MTNAEFMKDEFFKNCCAEAKVDCTKRQTSKFRMGKGKAWKVQKRVKIKEGKEVLA